MAKVIVMRKVSLIVGLIFVFSLSGFYSLSQAEMIPYNQTKAWKNLYNFTNSMKNRQSVKTSKSQKEAYFKQLGTLYTNASNTAESRRQTRIRMETVTINATYNDSVARFEEDYSTALGQAETNYYTKLEEIDQLETDELEAAENAASGELQTLNSALESLNKTRNSLNKNNSRIKQKINKNQKLVKKISAKLKTSNKKQFKVQQTKRIFAIKNKIINSKKQLKIIVSKINITSSSYQEIKSELKAKQDAYNQKVTEIQERYQSARGEAESEFNQATETAQITLNGQLEIAENTRTKSLTTAKSEASKLKQGDIKWAGQLRDRSRSYITKMPLK